MITIMSKNTKLSTIIVCCLYAILATQKTGKVMAQTTNEINNVTELLSTVLQDYDKVFLSRYY